jgi:DNA-binding transcriptional MerR regulator
LVLGSEELIKAFILLLDGKGFNLRKIKGVNHLFNNHQSRHNLSSYLLFVSEITKSIIYFATRIKSIHHGDINGKLSMPRNKIEELIQNGDLEEQKQEAKKWIELNESTIFSRMNEHFNFWKNIDKVKQSGFYVDHTGDIQSPKVISNQDFLYVSNHIKAQRRLLKKLINRLKSVPKNDLLVLINLFKTNKEIKRIVTNLVSNQKN